MKKWIGKNTAKNIIYNATGNSWKDIYNQLIDDNIINFYDTYEPIINDYAFENSIDLDSLEDDDFFEVIEKAYDALSDNDYIYYISIERGNAYYQTFIDDNDCEVLKV